ncbi:tyrosine recombinase XerC [mine drainage metagenome]|uniref:Tyrosine recombinase XerC n=1 Tax=mine drainage metagenome TaxID=410659 RepID=A0A1J5QQY0_9ZZZZ
MMQTVEVRVWDLRKVARSGRPVRYEVRWTVNKREWSKTYPHKAQADSFRSSLVASARAGTAFDSETGLPAGSAQAGGSSCFKVAKEMMEQKWADAAATARRTEVDNLAHLLVILIPPHRKAPDGLRLVLRALLGRETVELSAKDQDLVRWLERASLPIASVDDVTIRRVLKATAVDAEKRPYSNSVRQQRRVYLSGLFTYAVEQKLISVNPVAKVKAKHIKNDTGVTAVSPRQIGDLDTARGILENIDDLLYRDFTTCVLLAGSRPCEVAALRIQDCTLPADGWGKLLLAKSAASAGKDWTDSGEVRDDRGLKQRKVTDRRSVPIPPELVKILKIRISDRTDGPVFIGKRGTVVSDSAISRAWTAARMNNGIPPDVLPRVYDLRHLTASIWLNAGLPANVVAERLGHSTEVCLRVYAHVIESESARWNDVIERALK